MQILQKQIPSVSRSTSSHPPESQLPLALSLHAQYKT